MERCWRTALDSYFDFEKLKRKYGAPGFWWGRKKPQVSPLRLLRLREAVFG